jgi:hypothetical protein
MGPALIIYPADTTICVAEFFIAPFSAGKRTLDLVKRAFFANLHFAFAGNKK